MTATLRLLRPAPPASPIAPRAAGEAPGVAKPGEPTPARTENEERLRRQRAFLHEVAVRMSVAALILLFNEIFALGAEARHVIRVTAFSAIVLQLPYYLAARTGRALRRQAYVRMCLDVIMLTAGLYGAGGLAAAQYLSVYAIVPVYAGIVFSSRSCLMITGLATAGFVIVAGLQTAGLLPMHRQPLPDAWQIAVFNLLVLNIVGFLAALLAEAYRKSRHRLTALHGELERAHDESQRLNAHIQHAARLSVLGDVVGGVTHEVRNVLQAAFSHLWLMRRKLRGVNVDVLEHLDAVETSCEGAMRIIRTTLDMARQPTAERERVFLRAVAERVAKLKAYDLRRDRIVLTLEFEEDMPPVVAASFQLQQVLLNLVSNAQDELGHVPGPREIRIVAFVQGDSCVVEVRDNGRGIPLSALPHLFEPFYTTKSTGTGLGLPISAGIISTFGGKLSADNRSRGGAAFRITLPAAAQ